MRLKPLPPSSTRAESPRRSRVGPGPSGIREGRNSHDARIERTARTGAQLTALGSAPMSVRWQAREAHIAAELVQPPAGRSNWSSRAVTCLACRRQKMIPDVAVVRPLIRATLAAGAERSVQPPLSVTNYIHKCGHN